MKKLVQIILIVIGVFAVITGFLFFKIYSTSKLDMAEKADAIVVLGAAQYAGKPSPVLSARLNHAYELYKQNLAPLIITTGGTFPGEKFSEGEVGKKYLELKGVPERKIIAENQSLTTRQNLTRVKEIAEERNLSKIIFVSDPFHMYRIKQIAEDLELTPVLSPTRESPIAKNKRIEFQYILREMFLVAADTFFDF